MDNWLLSFKELLFISRVLVISPFAEGKIVKVYKWVLANKDGPPTPHNTAQHSPQRQVRKKLINFSLIFFLFPQGLKVLSKLLEGQIFSNYISFNEFPLALNILWLGRNYSKERIFCDIIVKLGLIEVIGNIEDRIVIASIFIINKNCLPVFINQNIIRQEIIMRKNKLALIWLSHFFDKFYLLSRYPLLHECEDLLLLRAIDWLGHFFMA